MKGRSAGLRRSFAAVALLVGCSSSSGPVAVLVEIPRPSGLGDEEIDRGFEASKPAFEGVPGLLRTYFTRTDSSFGGIDLWRSRSSADAFYDEGWRSRIQSTYGAVPTLRYFDVPVVTPGGSPEAANRESVVAVVGVKAPWYAPRRLIVGRMEGAVPHYTGVDGLVFKYFTIAEDGKVGGIYLWRDDASAAAFYDDTWHARIRQTYGEDGLVEMLSTPVQALSERGALLAADLDGRPNPPQ